MLKMLEELSLAGYGVAWNSRYEEFRPFTIEDGETINWWDDASDCASTNFNEAIVSTYEEIKNELATD